MAGLAFPIPSHLPRKQDVSSKILNKIDSATYRDLNSSLTATWLTELDETIRTTRIRLHQCIHSDLPLFRRQLESANSIQSKLQTLTNDVDSLNDAVTDTQSGLVPVLLRGLTKRSELVQEATDIEIRHQVLSHIFSCKKELAGVDALVASGQLAEAVVAIRSLDALLAAAPKPLADSDIFLFFTRKHQSIQALVQEQLSEAYTRSIVVSFSRLALYSSVQVRGSDALISLSSILSSLTTESLDQHLTTLRRDLLTHFIEYVLKEPSSISIDSTSAAEHSITLLPLPLVNDPKTIRIDSLSKILDFLSAHLFPIIPSPTSSAFSQSPFKPMASSLSFRQSLFKPIVSSLLNTLLIPSLPSSFGFLAPFLDLAKHAVTFESNTAILTGNSTQDLPIRAWVDGLSTHYEKQRRLELLSNCRVLVLSPEDSKAWFQFEIQIPSESAQANIVPVQPDVEAENADDNDLKDDAWGFEDETGDNSTQIFEKPKDEDVQDDDAWGFDEGVVKEEKVPVESSTLQEDVDNGWGFDDDMPIDEPEPVAVSSEPKSKGESEIDSGDAWGWNDDTNAEAEETTEDDPWDDDPWVDSPGSKIVNPVVSSVLPTPKTATRLEKIANKGKKPVNDSADADGTPVPIPLIPLPPHSIPKTQAKARGETRIPAPLKRPPDLKTDLVSREIFAVPEKARFLIRAVENIIDECKQFQASSLFPVNPTSPSASSSQAGSILAQTPASLIDLYISIYPVKFNEELTQSVQKGMLFSNSCFYLEHEIGETRKSLAGSGGFEVLKDKLEESSKNLSILGQSQFEQVIQTRCEKVHDILVDGAQGFKFTSDQDRYDECEMAINKVLQEIKRFGQQLKGILTKGKYYTAIGLVTEAALSQILQDILALSDIPEVDSHHLGELCRIFNSLEGLFSEDPTQPSFVVAYVPSWLKFNYLSELLEASMADISYLFDEGALVDFEIDELARLIKALFADSALRTNTINKLMNGHPVAPT